MNFLQLKNEICDEIESALTCYWNVSSQTGHQSQPGPARRVADYDSETPNSDPQFLVTK